MVTRAKSRERVLYAHWDVQVFRGIEPVLATFTDVGLVLGSVLRVQSDESSASRGVGGSSAWELLLQFLLTVELGEEFLAHFLAPCKEIAVHLARHSDLLMHPAHCDFFGAAVTGVLTHPPGH
jgi:hypothetical protein